MPGYILPQATLRALINRTAGNRGDDAICGIYELGLTSTAQSKDICVVYIGYTENIADRISCYCRTSSHKATEINAALRRNYNVFVRFNISDTGENAKRAETNILMKVTYAWNSQYPNPAPRNLPLE